MIYCSQIQECKIRPEIINVNNKEPIFYPYKIKMNRCVGSCNTIDDPYGKTCFANDIENIALKVFNLLSQNKDTINIEKHKSCECKCKLNKDACNNKQIWNKDTCKCECKKINIKEVCDSGFIWNQSVCICQCNKYCDIYECLDQKNCICRGKMAESLTEKCEKILMKLWILFHQVIIIKHLILVLYYFLCFW